MKPILLIFLLVLAALSTNAAVEVYPAPKDEPLSADYQVTAGGQPVDVYTARVLDPPFAGKEWDYGGPYSFCSFDLEGPVEIRVASTRSLRNTEVRPASLNLKIRIESDNALVVSLSGPCKFSIEPDGKKGPLLLFANPLEKDRPKPGAPGMVYFGPGQASF